jgi:hypothetical protein
MEISNSNTLDGMTELGSHVSHMAHKSQSAHPSVGYRPTHGLNTLFPKMEAVAENLIPHYHTSTAAARTLTSFVVQWTRGSTGEQ